MRYALWPVILLAWGLRPAAVPANDLAATAGLVGRIDFEAGMPQKQAPGVATYIEGLGALEAGKFAVAEAALTRSIQANDEAAAYYTARRRLHAVGETRRGLGRFPEVARAPARRQ